MKKIIASVAITIMACLGISGFAVAQAVPVLAANDSGLDAVKTMTGTTKDGANKGNETDLMPMIQVIVNVVIGVLGVLCVAMIIVGGIMYTTSQGQPDKVKQAKDIILYSIIGLVVALLAFAVVNFVLTNVFNK